MGLLGDIVFNFAFLGFGVFSILYFFRSDWSSTPVGRNAMAFMGACWLLLGLSFIRLISGDAWFELHRDVLRLVSYLILSSVVWWRVVLLIKLQRRPRRKKPDRAPARTPDPTSE